MHIIIRPNEKIIKTFKIYKGSLNYFLPLIFLIILGFIFFKIKFSFNFWGYWAAAIGAISIILFITFLVKWTVWKNNEIVVTNQRVIYNNQKGLFSKVVTEIFLSDIHEVSYELDGIGETFSNYGTVRIKTGGSVDLMIKKVKNPQKVVETINNARI